MADDKQSNIPKVEMEIVLPHILKEPLRLEDGSTLAEGDRIQHEECGKGTIIRIWSYPDLGTLLYVDFGNGIKEEIHPHFVRKLE